MARIPTPADLEAAAIEFACELEGDERKTFTFNEAENLALELGYALATPVIRALKALGLGMEERQPERRVRTVSSNSHDRWSGPGSCKTHGGSGWEQITGFAGDEG